MLRTEPRLPLRRIGTGDRTSGLVTPGLPPVLRCFVHIILTLGLAGEVLGSVLRRRSLFKSGCFLVALPTSPRQATVGFSTTHEDGAAIKPQQMRSFWRAATGISKHKHRDSLQNRMLGVQISPPLPPFNVPNPSK